MPPALATVDSTGKGSVDQVSGNGSGSGGEDKGESNSGGVAAPTAQPPSGGSTKALNVTLSCATTGSTVYYTIDGSSATVPGIGEGGEGSRLPIIRDKPIEISKPGVTILRAVAVVGEAMSDELRARYSITAADLFGGGGSGIGGSAVGSLTLTKEAQKALLAQDTSDSLFDDD